MELDPVLLARIQFALTIGFHFIFPPLSIGLAWLLVIMEWRGSRGDADFATMGRFFGKLLGITFALGVATGVAWTIGGDFSFYGLGDRLATEEGEEKS